MAKTTKSRRKPSDVVAELTAEAEAKASSRKMAELERADVHEFLVGVLDHNDAQSNRMRRVKVDRILEVLEERFDVRCGRSTLNAFARTKLGRYTWERKQ